MKQTQTMTFPLGSGDMLQVSPLSSHIIRVRMRPDTSFSPSVTERYGVVKNQWEITHFQLIENEAQIEINMEGMSVRINTATGDICLKDGSGKTLIEEIAPFPTKEKKGVGAAFTLSEEERFYGLGYRKTDYVQLRGHIFRNHVSYGECYGPSPFLMSSGGWGLYFNTTFDSYFDIGFNEEDRMNVWSMKGELDFYLMTGDMKNLLNLYTDITGKPTLMPLWGYGLMFICNEKETQFDVLNDARTFRQEGIPCDMIGLEPGWMASHYDASVKKDWNRERFYMPWWSEERKQFKDMTFIGALERNHFQLSLWLCCDYDVFAEEERQAERNGFPREPEGEQKEIMPFGFGKLDFDPRAHAPVYMDQVTVKDEPWFTHLKKFIDGGVTAFKQDPAYIVNNHPDRLYANGMLDEEAHNIWTTVLAKQVHLGYREYTGNRPMHFMGTAYTGIQKWAPTWTCDCGGREEALMECFKFYAKLHYSLLPYIYGCAHQGTQTGMPIVRPMPLMYPEELRLSELNRQYMLGEWLLVTAFSNQVCLPEGTWIDYWTGEEYSGAVELEYKVPEGKGGCLFIKRGAIIPYWHGIEHAPQKPMDHVDIHIYPEGITSFTLYEDDGITFAYENGAYAETEICCSQKDRDVEIRIHSMKRDYEKRPKKYFYHLTIFDERPEELYINQIHSQYGAGGWEYDAEKGAIRITIEDDGRNEIQYARKEKQL